MQDRPHLILGHPGFERFAHIRHAGFAHRDCHVHASNLVWRFDQSGELHRFRPIEQLDLMFGQRTCRAKIDAVTGNPPVAPTVLAHQFGHFFGPISCLFVTGITSVDVAHPL